MHGVATVTAWIGVISAIVTLIAAVVKLPPGAEPLFCSVLFGLIVLYCVYDLCSWYWLPGVWVFGVAGILITVYWWIGFLAKHGIPAAAILPDGAYPSNCIYLLFLGYLVGYSAWDMSEALHRNWTDKDELVVLGSCVIVILFALLCFTWAA